MAAAMPETIHPLDPFTRWTAGGCAPRSQPNAKREGGAG
jgi:hypothetical protein